MVASATIADGYLLNNSLTSKIIHIFQANAFHLNLIMVGIFIKVTLQKIQMWVTGISELMGEF